MAKKIKSPSFDTILAKEEKSFKAGDGNGKSVDVLAIVSAAEPARIVDVTKMVAASIEVRERALHLEVKTDIEEGIAADLIKEVKTGNAFAEDLRKQKVSPINELVKRINDIFRPITENLTLAETTIKQKVIAYRQYKERLRVEEERKRDEEYRRKVEVERLKAQAEKKEFVPPPPPPVVIPPENTTHGASGSLSSRKVWRFRILDVTKVPADLIRVDEIAVNAKIRNMVANRLDPTGKIPGLEIYQEDSIASR